ncbi:MAG TPA: TetR/AcrR family transcriptional regulator, partial [Caulobacteraceae bacterium]|nr:TetR/AcrR family transcriptional regulator [Caulobacteraceae bacterium]
GPVSMAAIAKAAGLSRQTLYLTFADRADLYISLARRVDELRGVPAERAKVEQAPDGVTAIRLMIDMYARLNPAHRAIAHAFDVLRHQDPDAERAWQDRLDSRRELCATIVDRLAAEGRLRPGVDRETATDIASNLTSFRAWDELVVQCGWSSDRYRTQITSLLLLALVGEPVAAS